jgi:hypothetical protein
MADFCGGCTARYIGVAPEKNDITRVMFDGGLDSPLDKAIMLCEGCGMHVFYNDGRRLCSTPDNVSPEDVTGNLCDECRTLIEMEKPYGG